MRKGIWLRLAAAFGGCLLIGGIAWRLLGPPAENSVEPAERPPVAAESPPPGEGEVFAERNWSDLDEGDPRAVPVDPEARAPYRTIWERTIEDLSEELEGLLVAEGEKEKP